jgi:peptidoglycan/xylan/chitin deacetylase (PgdA/CDA1 family)
MRCLFPKAIFRIETSEKILSLTFDDGPDPSSTLHILEIIEKYNIKALFFCSGVSAKKYPELMQRIISGGHMTGNHGFLHIDGFKTSTHNYLENVSKAESFTSDLLFRPPYGRIRPAQYRKLAGKYRIIMWDLMVYDFDYGFGKEKSAEMLKKKMRPGSVIVLHDKPESTVHDFLEEFILYCFEMGFRFCNPTVLF